MERLYASLLFILATILTAHSVSAEYKCTSTGCCSKPYIGNNCEGTVEFNVNSCYRDIFCDNPDDSDCQARLSGSDFEHAQDCVEKILCEGPGVCKADRNSEKSTCINNIRSECASSVCVVSPNLSQCPNN